MPTTLRTNLRTAIVNAFGEPAVTDVAFAHVLPVAGRSREYVQAITEARAAGKHCVELIFGHDEAPENGQEAGQVDDFRFAVDVLCHLREDGEQTDHVTYEMMAELFAAEVYLLCCGNPEVPGSGGDGTWGGLAITTEFLGGGGVFISDIGTVVTGCSLEVLRRMDRGKPFAE